MLIGNMCSIDFDCIFNNSHQNNNNMRAPEKIWIDLATDLPKLSGHIDNNSVEYTRTDAFVKKACEVFCKIRCKGKPPRSTCTSLGTCKEYDKFKKAMKGE